MAIWQLDSLNQRRYAEKGRWLGAVWKVWRIQFNLQLYVSEKNDMFWEGFPLVVPESMIDLPPIFF